TRFDLLHPSPLTLYHSPFFLLLTPRPPSSTLFPYTTLFRSQRSAPCAEGPCPRHCCCPRRTPTRACLRRRMPPATGSTSWPVDRSEEHTSELQSRGHLVCRLLLEKKKNKKIIQSETRTESIR